MILSFVRSHDGIGCMDGVGGAFWTPCRSGIVRGRQVLGSGRARSGIRCMAVHMHVQMQVQKKEQSSPQKDSSARLRSAIPLVEDDSRRTSPTQGLTHSSSPGHVAMAHSPTEDASDSRACGPFSRVVCLCSTFLPLSPSPLSSPTVRCQLVAGYEYGKCR